MFCISFCTDAPAKALMQNMIQCNGCFSCSCWYHPGENITVSLINMGSWNVCSCKVHLFLVTANSVLAK